MRRSTLLHVMIDALTVCLVLFFSGGLVWAQAIRSGQVEVGQQTLGGDRASSKFQEYRQLPSGLFLNKLHLNLGDSTNRRYLQFQATRAAQENQSVFLQTGLLGKVALDIKWDQTPHLLSTNGRTLFTQPSQGVFFLPVQTRLDLNKLVTTDTNPAVAGVQPDLTAIGNLVNGTARGVDLRTQRKTAEVALRYTPTNEWNVKVQYSNEKRSGSKPVGATFQFASINELPQPIDYRTQELKASSEYATKRWSAQFAYTNSIFTNDVKSLVWDNPFYTVDKVGAPSKGRYVLGPDNTAQNLSFLGAVNIAKATRLSAGIGYGWRRQDDPFVPYTINTAITTLGPLPAASLDGKVNILTTNVTLTSRPVRNLSLNARYRLYDYANKTPMLTWTPVGYGDYQAGAYPRNNLPIAHTRQNAGIDLGYQFIPGVNLKVGYGWENYERTYRDAKKTDENSLQAALNLVPNDYLSLRTSYVHAVRETHDYDFEVNVAEHTFPAGEGFTLPFEGLLPEARRFDMAARTRDLVNTMVRVSPNDMISFSGSVGYGNDDFNKSEYGMLMNRNTQYSVGVELSPSSRFGLFSDYTREDFKYNMKSRQRNPPGGTPAAPTPANDSPANDWRSDMKDDANTFEAGINGVLVDKKLDAVVSYLLSDAGGMVTTDKLGNGTLVTTVENYPATSSRLHQMVASLRYHLSANVTPRFEYRYERYTESYFSQIPGGAPLQPYMGKVDATVVSSAFLGATQPGYKAHIFSVLIGYSF